MPARSVRWEPAHGTGFRAVADGAQWLCNGGTSLRHGRERGRDPRSDPGGRVAPRLERGSRRERPHSPHGVARRLPRGEADERSAVRRERTPRRGPRFVVGGDEPADHHRRSGRPNLTTVVAVGDRARRVGARRGDALPRPGGSRRALLRRLVVRREPDAAAAPRRRGGGDVLALDHRHEFARCSSATRSGPWCSTACWPSSST